MLYSAHFNGSERHDMDFASAIGFTVSIVLAVAIVAAAHYLQQIRDVLRDIRETQRKVAAKLGVSAGK